MIWLILIWLAGLGTSVALALRGNERFDDFIIAMQVATPYWIALLIVALLLNIFSAITKLGNKAQNNTPDNSVISKAELDKFNETVNTLTKIIKPKQPDKE